MKKLLMVSCFFPPQRGPSVQRSYFMARHLPEFGWEPTVLTTALREDEHWDDSLDTSGMDIRTVRTWETPGLWSLLNRWRLHFLTRHVTCWDRLGFLIPGLTRLKRLIETETFDAVYFSISPNCFLLLATAIRPLTDKPIIIDYRDPSFDYEDNVWQNPVHRHLTYRLTESANESADLIICNTPAIKEQFARRWPSCRDKTIVIRNGWGTESLGPPSPPADRFVISHAGTLNRPISGRGIVSRLSSMLNAIGSERHEPVDNRGRSLDPLTRALRLLKDSRPDIVSRISFETAGLVNGTDWSALVDTIGPERCIHHGVIPYRKTRELFDRSHVLFLPHRDHAVSSRTVLSKMYEYLSAHRPILACLPPGQMRDDLAARGHVRFASPLDPKSVAEALIDIHDNHESLMAIAAADDVSDSARRNRAADLARALAR